MSNYWAPYLNSIATNTLREKSVMMSEREKIDLITRISLDINEVKDIDLLLERILTNVRQFFNADAGSIYLKEGERQGIPIAQFVRG
jgi:hypothetical protein